MAAMTSRPVLRPVISCTQRRAISSGVTNSICPMAVMASNSPLVKTPFSPVSTTGRRSSASRSNSRGIEAEVQAAPQGLRPGGVERHRAALLRDGAVADVGVADEGAGLDLLHHRPPGGAAHQEQEPGVGEGHRRLGEQLGRGAVLAVGVGDVQPHAAGAGGPDLDVEAGPRIGQGPVEQHHMAHQLRHRQGEDEGLHVAGQPLRGHPAPFDDALHIALRQDGGGVDVLVGDGGRRVDRVDDHIRPVGGDEAGQAGAVVGGVQRPEEVVEDRPPAGLVVEQLLAAAVGELLPDEEVPGLAGHLDACRAPDRAGAPRPRATSVVGKRGEHDALGAERVGHLMGHLESDHAGAAEHEECPVRHEASCASVLP